MIHIPLAERQRPKSFNEYIGQEHLTGPEGSLWKQIQGGFIHSFILWGPPGTGKTTLAKLICTELDCPFFNLSAINSGVKEVREVIEKASKNTGLYQNKRSILFIDEIHRFSKSQQDSLLAAVEKGIITLIGATTENPGFEVIPALLSRCQVYVLNPLTAVNLKRLLNNAIENDSEIKKIKPVIKEYETLILLSGGDARRLLNLFELICFSIDESKEITNEKVSSIIKQNPLLYDKNGEQHYDIISAFIKSIRGSDPNAAVYWLARMIESGEDLKFIARRLLISASEDIGNANPNALILANSTFQAVSIIGYPESRILLSQCTIYLATSPKSNASYEAIGKAQAIVKETGNLPVPMHLRNAANKLLKEMDYGKDYKYSHDFPFNFTEQEFMPDLLNGTTLYEPGNNPKEQNIKDILKKLWGNKYKY